MTRRGIGQSATVSGGRLILRRAIPVPVLSLAAGPVEAHAVDAGADAFAQFAGGAAVILITPAIVLPLLALGILLSLWRDDGLPQVWPLFLAAQVAGVLAAALAGPEVVLVLTGLGIAIAAVPALAASVRPAVAYGAAGLAGFVAMLTAFEGHGPFELPVFTHLGLLFGANLATALAAGVSRIALVQVSTGWMRIGWRVAASGIGAVLTLMLILDVPGPVS